jgi:indole-3-glycerol phosphate synthase
MGYPRDRRLEQILIHKRLLLEARKREVPVEELRVQTTRQTRPLDIASFLKENRRIALVAEVKRASPGGLLVERYNPVTLALRYQECGASILSVATDETVLQGGLAHLMAVKGAARVPVLRQDFIVDEYQIIEARAAGADGLRIIAAILGDRELWRLVSLTQRMKMTELIEVHNEDDLERALPLDPRLIGINNRDLVKGTIDLSTTERLRDRIPAHIAVISEGGIRTAQDVRRMADLGVHGVAIGEVLLTADDLAAKFRELMSLI